MISAGVLARLFLKAAPNPEQYNLSKCLRQSSARGRREGFPQMGVPTMRVRAESVPTFTFLQKWFRTLAKGETKSNKNKIFEEV